MLYIVSTPIGNLSDITKRAVDILDGVDLIIVEDIQDARRLLSALDIKGKKIIKYNDRNKKSVIDKIIGELIDKDGVYITSAGTPGISDPGYDLVKVARDNGIKINVIPGPSALVSALAVSGINIREFSFVSFLPRKKGKIKKIFEKYNEEKKVLVFFESPFRIISSLEVLGDVSPNANVFVAKEMTKMFENYFTGSPSDVIKQLKSNPKNTKGEFVVVVEFV